MVPEKNVTWSRSSRSTCFEHRLLFPSTPLHFLMFSFPSRIQESLSLKQGRVFRITEVKMRGQQLALIGTDVFLP
jgi:hypothetical protein